MSADRRAAYLILAVFSVHVLLFESDRRAGDNQIQQPETWGCDALIYIGPTGENYAVYASEWSPWRLYAHEWPKLTKPWSTATDE